VTCYLMVGIISHWCCSDFGYLNCLFALCLDCLLEVDNPKDAGPGHTDLCLSLVN
jgi:hypothetical protein